MKKYFSIFFKSLMFLTLLFWIVLIIPGWNVEAYKLLALILSEAIVYYVIFKLN